MHEQRTTSIWDRPRIGFVLALIVALGGGLAYFKSESESRVREIGDMKTRISVLESRITDCGH